MHATLLQGDQYLCTESSTVGFGAPGMMLRMSAVNLYLQLSHTVGQAKRLREGNGDRAELAELDQKVAALDELTGSLSRTE